MNNLCRLLQIDGSHSLPTNGELFTRPSELAASSGTIIPYILFSYSIRLSLENKAERKREKTHSNLYIVIQLHSNVDRVCVSIGHKQFTIFNGSIIVVSVKFINIIRLEQN